MTTQTTVVGTPTLPRVNLLPPEIAEARTLKQYRLGAVGAVVLAAAGVAVFYVQAHGGVATAQSALDASKAKTAALKTQLASYQNVTQVKNEVQTAQATLATALAPQILWSKYLQDMSVSLVGNYWFTGMTMSGSGSTPASSSGATSPLADGSAIGTITLSGTAISHYDVADLLRSLAKQQGLSSKPIVASSVKAVSASGLPLITFSVTQTVDSNGLPSATTPATAPARPAGVTVDSGATTTPTKAANN